MTKVLMSLSRVSSSAMAWMIMLSTLFTLNLTLAREYECARPSCACFSSASFRPSMKRVKCARTPRSTSPTISLLTQGMPVVDWISEPSLGSPTPSLYLAFLASLDLARLVSRNVLSSGVSVDSEMALICTSASAADAKGLKAVSLQILPKRAMSLTASCTFSAAWLISSNSFTSSTAKPDADSNSTYVVAMASVPHDGRQTKRSGAPGPDNTTVLKTLYKNVYATRSINF
mmetsp:Transcript_21551/g.54842  ORF Transcript_21551/g.54842 Transcript_21551/m.54842 type:complete len:231 (-) Transcript_21551:20-712(-)